MKADRRDYSVIRLGSSSVSSALRGKRSCEQVAAAADGGAEGVAGLPGADAGGDGGDDPVPFLLRDDGADAAVGQHPDPAFEEGDEDQHPGGVAGLVQAVLEKGDQGLLLHLGDDLRRMDEPPLEAGQGADQPAQGR